MMIKHLPFFFLLFFSIVVRSQSVVINEIDSDTPSTDVMEFIELKTATPNMSLDGYVVVLYNGSNDQSYAAFDLDGYNSDANGLFVLGNSSVSPTPSLIFSNNTLQNGADAVALYQDDASSFPSGTAVTATNLIDAIVYDTSDADDTGLLTGLGKTEQINENENSDKDHQSIQRKADGTYEVKAPTPDALNEGGGVVQTSITISTPKTEYNEGDVIDLTFTASDTLTADLILTYTLENGEFNSGDFTGGLTATIDSGTMSVSMQITLVDDTLHEDIETAIVKFVDLDAQYQAQNDNYPITVYDNDYTTSPWGTPLNPTYGLVSSTAPEGYYDSLDGKSGQGLKDAITAIIADPTTVRAQTYGDIWDILKEADENPENNDQVWLVYTEQGRYKSLQQGSDGGVGKWNREHIYPQSRGGFSDGTSSTADGKDVYMSTDATHLEHAHGDGFNLRPADPTENSTRNNHDYGEDYDGPSGTKGSWRGDVARSLFFDALRYDGLSLVPGNPDDSTVGQLGDLDSLLVWNKRDKPDDYEMHRNNVIYTWQYNRNPFIDLPDLADYVFGDKQDQVWNSSTAVVQSPNLKITYSNPVTRNMYFNQNIKGNLDIYNILGEKLYSSPIDGNKVDLGLLDQGIYLFVLQTGNATLKGKMLKK